MTLRETLFTARGRLSRGAFLHAYALVWVCGMAAGMVTIGLHNRGLNGASFWWTALWAPVYASATCCLAARRAHDLGRPIRDVAMVFLVAFLAWDAVFNIVQLARSFGQSPLRDTGLTQALFDQLSQPTAISVAASLSWCGVFVWLAVAEGQDGRNPFGEPSAGPLHWPRRALAARPTEVSGGM